ncbi:retrovirus-related pol polyprotein from transposon TNT 1-94 [Tanacetum coccineum]
MDVKSDFLYGKIEEEVYVCQPPGFEDPHFPDKVYKVEKALYGLHQAPRAWFMLMIHLWINQETKWIKNLETLKHNKFQRSSMGELSLFGTIQVKQKSDGIFISQDKYVAEILKKFDFALLKTASTPMETNKALIKDEEAEDVDVHLYRLMIGSLMYLTASRTDIMFVVCACARQMLWIQNQMLDYGFNSMNTKIYIDNESTICIVKNPVFHFKTKHIEIGHHFIRDLYEKKLIQVIKIHIDQNVANLLIKAFDASRVKSAKVSDEAVHKELGDKMERAATIASSLEAEQDSGSGPRCLDTILGDVDAQTRSDLHLEDAEGTDYLPTTTIFEELAKMGLRAKSTAWNEFSSTMAFLIICLATNKKFNLSKYIFDDILEDMSHHKKVYVNPFYTKKIFANMKRAGKDFSRRITPLFDTMMVQASEEMGEDSDHLSDSNQIPIVDQPSTSSQPKQKQKSKRKQRQEAEVAHDET